MEVTSRESSRWLQYDQQRLLKLHTICFTPIITPTLRYVYVRYAKISVHYLQITHLIWNINMGDCLVFIFVFSTLMLEQNGRHLHMVHPLQLRHDGRDSVSNHQPHDCLLNRLFRRRSKKTSKLRVTGLCAGNSPRTGEFPAQMASNAENVSIWWRHHSKCIFEKVLVLWVKFTEVCSRGFN